MARRAAPTPESIETCARQLVLVTQRLIDWDRASN
jgi:hypothetical protein